MTLWTIIAIQIGMIYSSPIDPCVLRGSIVPSVEDVRELQMIDPIDPVHFNCTFAPVDCSNNGVCNQDGSLCICNNGYVTHGSGNQCNYAQKKQVIAFLLSFFFPGTGASYFYMGLQTLGLANLFAVGWMSIINLGLCFCCCRFSGINKSCIEFLLYTLLLIDIVGLFIWWLILTIQTGMNTLNDSNNVPLVGW